VPVITGETGRSLTAVSRLAYTVDRPEVGLSTTNKKGQPPNAHLVHLCLHHDWCNRLQQLGKKMIFRTPASFYRFEPTLSEHIEKTVMKFSILQAAGNPPFGLDLNNLCLIQEKEKAFVVAPVNDEDGNHIADFPIVSLLEGWPDHCAFPLVIFPDGFGEVGAVC